VVLTYASATILPSYALCTRLCASLYDKWPPSVTPQYPFSEASRLPKEPTTGKEFPRGEWAIPLSASALTASTALSSGPSLFGGRGRTSGSEGDALLSV